MPDRERLEAQVLVESYERSSPDVVRLAELVSPACRIEPQLLRQLRLGCAPGVDVSIEQEVWFSELVNERGATITLRAGVVHILRQRLRALRQRDPALVDRARRIATDMHAALPPLLQLEDQLAWAEVFQDDAAIASGARTLVGSLLARRDGLDHWLGRAWNGLPADLKQRPEGRALAHVAAAKGAQVDGQTTPAGADTVAHLLPLTPIPLRLHGLALTVNAPPAEATHVIDAPQTQPRALAIASGGRSEQLVFGAAEAKTVHVAAGTVVIRTVAGDEYELEASDAASTAIRIELLPAGHSTCVLIGYPDGGRTRWILVGVGDKRAGRQTQARLEAIPTQDPIELLVLTHTDDGHIGGAAALLESPVGSRIRGVWFNTPHRLDQVQDASV